MDAPLWLKMLQEWLERHVQEEAEPLRVRRERNELAARKAEVTAWYFSQP
jgi:hypothetical protein